jgi:hypothetical protein
MGLDSDTKRADWVPTLVGAVCGATVVGLFWATGKSDNYAISAYLMFYAVAGGGCALFVSLLYSITDHL